MGSFGGEDIVAGVVVGAPNKSLLCVRRVVVATCDISDIGCSDDDNKRVRGDPLSADDDDDDEEGL